MREMRHDRQGDHKTAATLNPVIRELGGYLDLGMRREALRLARVTLKASPITAELFNASLNVILTLVDRLRPWLSLVESAFARMTKRQQRQVRFMMLSLHHCLGNHEAASRFLPRRFSASTGLLDLCFGMETMLALDRMDEAGTLARNFPNAIESAENTWMQGLLIHCLAAYLARAQKWGMAIELWERLQRDHCCAESAMIGLVELHLARALLAVRSGLESLKALKKDFDPELELELPGNDKARWEEAEKKLKRLGRMVEKVLPEANRRDFGLDKE